MSRSTSPSLSLRSGGARDASSASELSGWSSRGAWCLVCSGEERAKKGNPIAHVTDSTCDRQKTPNLQKVREGSLPRPVTFNPHTRVTGTKAHAFAHM